MSKSEKKIINGETLGFYQQDFPLLKIHYVEFDLLEGWKSGKFISQIHYDGEEVFVEFTLRNL